MSLLKRFLIITICTALQLFMMPLIGSGQVDTISRLAKDSSFQADALYYDAVKARMKGDDREEERLLTTVIKFKPDAGGAYYDLSRLCFRQNRPDKASEYITKAIAIEGDNIWYKRQYAEILSLGNKYLEAANLFLQIGKQEKHNESDLRKAAKLYQHTGKYKEALQVLDLLLLKDADNEELLAEKKSIFLKLNDAEGAAKVIQGQIERNPTEGRHYAELAEVYENNKMPEKANALYKKMELEFTDDALVQYSLANYYKRNNNLVKYKEYTRKVITNKSLDIEMQLAFLGSYLLEYKNDSIQREDGLLLIRTLVEQYPNNGHVLAFYGDALRMNDKVEEATEQYKKSIKADPSVYSVWESLLISYLSPNTADSLVLYTEKSLRIFPNQAMFHYMNGIAYTFKREYTKAIKSLNRAIDMQPEDKTDQLADMYVALGDAYNYIKEYKQSDESYDKALKLEPNNPTLLNNYSYYLSVRGIRLDDAERMSKKSLDLRKDEPTFLDTYGWVLYKQAKYDKALEYIQKAIDATGENADGTLWEHLGDVYYKQGNIDKAVECWVKAKNKGTENQNIDNKIKDRKLYES